VTVLATVIFAPEEEAELVVDSKLRLDLNSPSELI